MERSYVNARVLFYSPSRGGRPFVPIRDGYAPYVRAEALTEDLPIRVNKMPINGQFETPYEAELELSYHPKIDYGALAKGTKFSLVEGPKVIGEGVVLSDIVARPIQSTTRQ